MYWLRQNRIVVIGTKDVFKLCCVLSELIFSHMQGINMSRNTYITLRPEEKNRLSEAIEQDFGQNRITQGAYIKILAEERINGGRDDE